MRNWTLRELLLLVTVMAFVLFHVGNAVRIKVTPLEDFEVTADEFHNWAKGVDPQSSRRGSSSQTSNRQGVRITRFQELEIETTSDKTREIVRHWRHRVQEKIDQNGWLVSGGGSGGDEFSYSIWKLDSLYDVNFYCQSTPIPVDNRNKDPNRVRLSIRWIAIGYTRLRDDKRLIAPAPAAP
jgi:hypothetical protein